MTLTVGALFTGAGGLELGVSAVLGNGVVPQQAAHAIRAMIGTVAS